MPEPNFGECTVSLGFGPVVARKVADDRDRPAGAVHPIADLRGHREPSCDYDWFMFSKRTRANRRGEAADRPQRQPEHPLDEIFQKDAKRIRRRHGWSAAVEVALAVLDMLPW